MSRELDAALARLFSALAVLGEKAGKILDAEVLKANLTSKAYQSRPKP